MAGEPSRMEEGQRRGMAGAVAMLVALANGVLGHDALRAASGLPRSSYFRVLATLRRAGWVEMRDGLVRAGPAAAAMAQAPLPAVLRMPVRSGRAAPEPLRLAAPALRRPRRMRIGFSNAALDNPWRYALVHAVEFAAARLSDRVALLAIRHAGGAGADQAADIAALLEAGIDGLLVSAGGDPGVGAMVAAAEAAGVAVVAVDRPPPPGAPHRAVVTGSDHDIGRLTALWLAERLRGRGRILMLPGRQDARPAQDRLAAARAVLAGFPDLAEAGLVWTGWRAGPARAAVAERVAGGERIDAIWCDSGLQAAGAMRGWLAAGRGRAPLPPLTGGDLNLSYKLALRHGAPLAAVDYPAAMGLVALRILARLLSGRWAPARVVLPSEVILTRGHATPSVRPTIWAEDHVRWDLPDDLILQTGLGEGYDPHRFRIRYPGNSYNRSAAQLRRAGAAP